MPEITVGGKKQTLGNDDNDFVWLSFLFLLQIRVEENGVVIRSKTQAQNKDPAEYNQTYQGWVNRKSVSANDIIYP